MLAVVLVLALLAWAAVTVLQRQGTPSHPDSVLFPRETTRGPDGASLSDPVVPTHSSRTRTFASLIAIGAAALWVVFSVTRGWLIPEEHVSPEGLEGASERITSQRGVETSPSLSPDGEWIAYRVEVGGAGDIFIRNVSGDRIHNLTAQLGSDESDPAFSPDGRQIAFRSTFRNGGIYLIDRDGGDVRRLTNFGASPAWTPDGRSIVFATRSSIDPRSWGGISEGWVVDVASGRTSRLTRGDFRQPAVSPGGRHVAFWSAAPPPLNSVRARPAPRIRIMGIDGRNPRQLGVTAHMDWSPVWSSNGEFLYFLSDRGGRTSIWRAAIDRTSGAMRGDPVRLAAKTDAATHLTISSNGRHLAWSTLEWSPTMFSVEFEPDTRSARGDPTEVYAGGLFWRCGEPSPDGSMLAFAADDEQRDIYLLSLEDGQPRPVTEDEAVEGCPRWSPDGSRIIFHSNAGGLNKLWTAGADGSGLRVLASAIGELTHPVWAPDGRAVATWDGYLSTVRLFRLTADTASGSETWPVPAHPFTPVAWSPDGTKLAGLAAGTIWIFDTNAGAYEPLVAGSAPTWLSTGRRLIFATDGRLVMLDLPSRYTRDILSIPDVQLDTPFLSPEDRRLYFNRNQPEANIWMLTLR